MNGLGLAPNLVLTREFIELHGGAPLLKRYKSLDKLLLAFFPEEEVLPSHRRYKQTQKSQMIVFGIIRSMFKDMKMQYNFRHSDLKYENSFSIQ
jgi:hypothetical protein